MISEAATAISGDSPITLAVVVVIGGMVVALIRFMVKTEHTQAAHAEASKERTEWQRQHQTWREQVEIRLDRLERPPDERSHPGRTGRFPTVGDR